MIKDILNKTNISIKSVSFYAMIMDGLKNEEDLLEKNKELVELKAKIQKLTDKYEPKKPDTPKK